ncbi:MAG TPA: hypothetical protein VE153_21925 [Myxococcus sp.]|nr:hypothetical protein [Myxococcus sp.]
MLSLALALLLSQSAPPVSPEVFVRFDTEKTALLPALASKYACEKPGREVPHPLCDVAQSEQKGTAADIRGKNALLGLSWAVKRGKAGKVEVGAPRLSALALNKDSVGVWGAVTEITPEDAAEKRMLGKLAKDFAAHLEGRKASVQRPPYIVELLEVWSKSANHLVEKKDTAWVFKGTPSALSRVGERWVLVGVPQQGEGILVSVFVP